MENDLQICVGPKRTIKPEQSANHYKFSANVFLFIRFGSFLANEFQDCSNIRTFLNILYVQAGHVWLHADFVRMLIKGRVWNEKKKKPCRLKLQTETSEERWRPRLQAILSLWYKKNASQISPYLASCDLHHCPFLPLLRTFICNNVILTLNCEETKYIEENEKK